MTDLLQTLPNFPIKTYAHLITSLEQHLITTTDLLTLDAAEIAKRAQLPVLDVRRLANHITSILQKQLGLNPGEEQPDEPSLEGDGEEEGALRKSGNDLTQQWTTISTLVDELDTALGGGIPPGYITEITGESGAGKTQLLLTLLLSAQLPPPHGLSRPTCYISTEHPLPTTRLSQLLRLHPLLSTHLSPPSLSQIHTLQTPDLESQDHILTYQLPVALARYNIGLLIIDSIAANFRAETSSSTTASTSNATTNPHAHALAHRSTELLRLGNNLRSLAKKHNCAIVVANQVADRFAPLSPRGAPTPLQRSFAEHFSSSPQIPSSSSSLYTPSFFPLGRSDLDTFLSLDHQQCFFTGWGDLPPPNHSHPLPPQNLKTPSLGLVWANQIACRIALIKEESYLVQSHAQEGEAGVERAEWAPRRWRRWMRIVYAPWVKGVGEGEKGVEFEIWGGGLRAVGGG